jgi:lipopolysaccharide export system protein LptA
VRAVNSRARVVIGGSVAFALAAWLGSPPAAALQSDRTQPIHIQARTVQLDEKTGVAVYRGGVVLTQGTLRITADRLEVHTRARGRPERIFATGQPATLTMRLDGRREPLYAEAVRLEYDTRTRRATLAGAAFVRQGADSLRAETVHYWLDEERLEAEGGSEGGLRVQAVFVPDDEGRQDGEGAGGTVQP